MPYTIWLTSIEFTTLNSFLNSLKSTVLWFKYKTNSMPWTSHGLDLLLPAKTYDKSTHKNMIGIKTYQSL